MGDSVRTKEQASQFLATLCDLQHTCSPYSMVPGVLLQPELLPATKVLLSKTVVSGPKLPVFPVSEGNFQIILT